MSVMDYNLGRRYTPHNSLSFTDYYCDVRSQPFSLSNDGRADPRGYPFGGPVGGIHGRAGLERDETTFESGTSRRRIAVACARCRKRKIRCSGDPGNGLGCYSCKQAGVAADACQFHRVGSDNVQKVMDNFHIAQSLTGMANSNNMVPMYSVGANEPTYSRPATSQTYPPLDTKSIYPSTWTIPYSEDTSPVETYGLEQSRTYLANTVPVTNSNLYTPSCRWTYPTSRPFQQATNVYYDQNPYSNTHGLPYTPPKSRVAVANEPLSPMNMSSLELTLPSRPHPRRYRVTEGVARQLPFPQPSPAQTSRNAVDNLQDQRLRSGQGSSASFLRPLQPWNPNNDALVTANTAPSINTTIPVSTSTDGALDFLATAAIEGNTGVTVTASSPELNFTSSSLLDAMTAPAPSTKYSNFRESRANGRQSARLIRHDSQTNLYSYTENNSSKCISKGDEISDDCKLVNGRQYEPLANQAPQDPTVPESLHRYPYGSRNAPLHRASMGNPNTSF